MCEPPSDSARTAALWGWQAPDRDYPMSTHGEDGEHQTFPAASTAARSAQASTSIVSPAPFDDAAIRFGVTGEQCRVDLERRRDDLPRGADLMQEGVG